MGERKKERVIKGKTRERKGMGWTQGERRGRAREREWGSDCYGGQGKG